MVCKGIHYSKVSFSTFPAVVTRVPGFKRLKSLLCLLYNLQNCKQRATSKAQILLLSTLTCPPPKEVSLQARHFSTQPFVLATFSQIAKTPIYYARTYNYLHLHICMCLAGCPHSGPSARLALCPLRSWSVHSTKA